MYKRTPLEKRLRLRGKIYSFWGYDYQGERYTASTHQTDKKAALSAARQIERERSVPSTDRPSDASLIDALRLLGQHDKRTGAAENTRRFHIDRGRHLTRLIPPATKLTEITLALLNEYTDKRLAEKASRHTIQKEHRVLRHALALAKDAGVYDGEPKKLTVDGFKKARGYYKPGAVWLERPEWLTALLDDTSSNPDRHRLDRRDDIQCYVNLGVRRRELLAINPEHVHLAKRVVHVGGTKTEGADRVLPLNDAMMELFERRLHGARHGKPIFIEWGSGNRDLQANWKRARKRLVAADEKLDAVLPTGLTFNDLRRTFCSLMRNAGVSFEDCAALLGHTDIEMVRTVYGRTAMDTLHAAVAKLPELTRSLTQTR